MTRPAELEAFAKAEFATFLYEQGYRAVRDLGGGRYGCVMPLIFTAAIITGQWGDRDGYDDRWCYRTEAAARAALEAWGAELEPSGWHRHPLTGRRVLEDGSLVTRD